MSRRPPARRTCGGARRRWDDQQARRRQPPRHAPPDAVSSAYRLCVGAAGGVANTFAAFDMPARAAGELVGTSRGATSSRQRRACAVLCLVAEGFTTARSGLSGRRIASWRSAFQLSQPGSAAQAFRHHSSALAGSLLIFSFHSNVKQTYLSRNRPRGRSWHISACGASARPPATPTPYEHINAPRVRSVMPLPTCHPIRPMPPLRFWTEERWVPLLRSRHAAAPPRDACWPAS